MNRRKFIGIMATVPLWGMSRKAEHGIEGVVWRLVAFGRSRMAVPAHAWIELKEGAFRGNGGCNSLRGTYRVAGETIRFVPGPMTRMACAALALEKSFIRALKATDRYELSGETLILKQGGRALLVFSRDDG